MPVILDDDILIPPSMRRNRLPRRYYESTTIIEPSNASSSTIELPRFPEVITRPRSPLVIHREETTRIHPGRRREVDPFDDECSCCSSDQEYEFEAERRGGRRFYAEGSVSVPHIRPRGNSFEGPLETIAAVEGARRLAGHEYDKGYRRGRRDSKFDANEGEYFMEDGSRHNYFIEDVHPRPHHIPVYNETGYNESAQHHKKAKRLAEAGLTIAALGAAKELHDHRRGRARSLSPRSRSHSHDGRKAAAAAAVGATAAGLAVHQLREHRRRSRSRSVESYPSDEDHHRKAKIAAATAATIGGAALAAHHFRKRRDSGARSRSRSRSSSREGRHNNHTGRNIAAAALGGTAAGLAHHHYKHHRRPSLARPALRRSHSESSFNDHGRHGLLHRRRSPSPHKHSNLKKGAAIAAAAVVAKEAVNLYRARERSRSGSRSRNGSRSPNRYHHHRGHSPHRSGSPSPRRRSLGHRIADTVAGALDGGRNGASGHHGVRSRGGSMSEANRQHRGSGVQVPAPDRQRYT